MLQTVKFSKSRTQERIITQIKIQQYSTDEKKPGFLDRFKSVFQDQKDVVENSKVVAEEREKIEELRETIPDDAVDKPVYPRTKENLRSERKKRATFFDITSGDLKLVEEADEKKFRKLFDPETKELRKQQRRLHAEREKIMGLEAEMREKEKEMVAIKDAEGLSREQQIYELIREKLTLAQNEDVSKLDLTNLRTKFIVINAVSRRFDRIFHNFELEKIDTVDDLVNYIKPENEHVFNKPLFPNIDFNNLPENLVFQNYVQPNYRKKHVI